MESNKDALDAPGKSLVALCLSQKHRYFNTVSRCGTNMSTNLNRLGRFFCTIRYKMNLPTANIKEREDVGKSQESEQAEAERREYDMGGRHVQKKSKRAGQKEKEKKLRNLIERSVTDSAKKIDLQYSNPIRPLRKKGRIQGILSRESNELEVYKRLALIVRRNKPNTGEVNRHRKVRVTKPNCRRKRGHNY